MKLQAIWIMIRAHNFIVITERGYASCTPKFGHKAYWDNATEMFNGLKATADVQQKDFTQPTPKDNPRITHDQSHATG